MKPDDKARVRRFAPKTRNGCLTCKRRHTRCDERKPTCFTCERLNLRCMGYVIPRTWIFEPSQSQGSSRSPSSDGDKARISPSDDGTTTVVSPRKFNVESAPAIPIALVPSANEPAVIMEAYVHLATTCPMAWDSMMYQSSRRDYPPWLASQGVSATGPLRYLSFVAFATSALAHFEPRRYPIQLHLKYMHLAVASMRSVIAHNTYVLDDLLHGISKTLLAAVIQGDFESARAHLGAAASIVGQQGGMSRIDSNIGATLRYADLQLAAESLRQPAFPLFDDAGLQLELAIDTPAFPLFIPSNGRVGIDIGSLDRELVRLAHTVRHEAASIREPNFVAEAAGRLLDSAMVLAHGFATSSTQAIGVEELSWMGSHAAQTVYLLLKHCPNVLQKHPALHITQADSAVYEWVIVLTMWAVLLLCAANETVGPVSMRMNCVPLLHHDTPFANAVRVTLSKTVRDSLGRWNYLIVRARREWRTQQLGDWVQLVDIAAETERHMAAQFAPFVRRLFSIRHDRPRVSMSSPELDVRVGGLNSGRSAHEAGQHMMSPISEQLEVLSTSHIGGEADPVFNESLQYVR
jgi:hypothetical protein